MDLDLDLDQTHCLLVRNGGMDLIETTAKLSSTMTQLLLTLQVEALDLHVAKGRVIKVGKF